MKISICRITGVNISRLTGSRRRNGKGPDCVCLQSKQTSCLTRTLIGQKMVRWEEMAFP